MDFEHLLDRYAELIVKVGCNIQEGQWLRISAPIETAPFVRRVARHAYQAGAPFVDVLWSDEQLSLTRFRYAPEDSFELLPDWRLQMGMEHVQRGSAFLSIYAEDPELLKDVDPERVMRAAITQSTLMKPVSQAIMSDQVRWCVISLPVAAWARKVFPALSDDANAIQALWQNIFELCRLTNSDPIEAWRKHNTDLQARAAHLNARRYAKLHYKAAQTDFTVGLVEGHIWTGGGSKTADGLDFMPNIPTEEIFTTPHMLQADGIVACTKPYSYNGVVIRDFGFKFEGGRVVDFYAKEGLDALARMMDMDEGARRLGEVALVPHSSPIGQANLLFYNGLYDENAACHMALGKAYDSVVQGAIGKSREEQQAMGINDSLIHEDVMIGSSEMNIDGILPDGTHEAILRGGEWAF